MIANFNAPRSVFNSLMELPEAFYLTGSQYFHGQGNDVDFFTSYSMDMEIKLKELGFRKINSSGYNDSECLAVYRKRELTNCYDIQLVKNPELKKKVQEKFLEVGILSPTTDEWNLAFKLMR